MAQARFGNRAGSYRTSNYAFDAQDACGVTLPHGRQTRRRQIVTRYAALICRKHSRQRRHEWISFECIKPLLSAYTRLRSWLAGRRSREAVFFQRIELFPSGTTRSWFGSYECKWRSTFDHCRGEVCKVSIADFHVSVFNLETENCDWSSFRLFETA